MEEKGVELRALLREACPGTLSRQALICTSSLSIEVLPTFRCGSCYPPSPPLLPPFPLFHLPLLIILTRCLYRQKRGRLGHVLLTLSISCQPSLLPKRYAKHHVKSHTVHNPRPATKLCLRITMPLLTLGASFIKNVQEIMQANSRKGSYIVQKLLHTALQLQRCHRPRRSTCRPPAPQLKLRSHPLCSPCCLIMPPTLTASTSSNIQC